MELVAGRRRYSPWFNSEDRTPSNLSAIDDKLGFTIRITEQPLFVGAIYAGTVTRHRAREEYRRAKIPLSYRIVAEVKESEVRAIAKANKIKMPRAQRFYYYAIED